MNIYDDDDDDDEEEDDKPADQEDESGKYSQVEVCTSWIIPITVEQVSFALVLISPNWQWVNSKQGRINILI